MNPSAVRDKVAIVGMGCSKFGENWDKDPQDMIVDAAYEAYQDAGNSIGRQPLVAPSVCDQRGEERGGRVQDGGEPAGELHLPPGNQPKGDEAIERTEHEEAGPHARRARDAVPAQARGQQ